MEPFRSREFSTDTFAEGVDQLKHQQVKVEQDAEREAMQRELEEGCNILGELT